MGAAIVLKNGKIITSKIITGKNSTLMHVSSSLILNDVKEMADVPDNIHLLAPNITGSIGEFKSEIYNKKTTSLDLEEALIASIANPTCQTVIERLKELQGCEMHITHIPTPGDDISA